MVAGIYNIICEQGATFQRNLLWQSNGVPNDLTGYTARMQVRTDYASTTIVVELTTENSRISLGGTAGTIALTIPATITAALTPAVYVYDLELIIGSIVYRLVQGKFSVNPEVTK